MNQKVCEYCFGKKIITYNYGDEARNIPCPACHKSYKDMKAENFKINWPYK